MKHWLTTIQILISVATYGQNYQMEVTEQSWSGGICCISGTNYNITIGSSEILINELIIDSISINGHFFDRTVLNITNFYYENKHFTRIIFGESHDHEYSNEIQYQKPIKIQPHNKTPMVYAHINSSNYLFPIEKIKVLESLDYP